VEAAAILSSNFSRDL